MDGDKKLSNVQLNIKKRSMKWILIVLAFAGLGAKSLTQERFSLKLELVKPTGKVDSTSYFQCTLTNLTDTAFLLYSGNFLEPRTTQKCYFKKEIIYTDGRTEVSSGSSDGFIFMEDGCEVWVKRLGARESITQILPMFCDPRGYGSLPYNEDYIKTIKKFRIRLVEFQYENVGKYENFGEFESVRGETLLSNWVEVDADAVVALLRKRLKK